MQIRFFIVLLLCLSITATFAADPDAYVAHQNGRGRFALVAAVPLLVSATEYPGVIRALKNFQTDCRQVTHVEPAILTDKAPMGTEVVLVGTLGKSALIDQLVRTKKLDVSGITGKWETFLTQIVEKPMPGIERALVIAGSHKRGTIYGIYDLSAQIGLSPWNWWADVPVIQPAAVYVFPGRHTQGTPAVKYRGIFINDEAPALSGWSKEKFGGFNHKFYEKVFELILRVKGNYLWPAMWGSAFYDDDSLNPQLADEYGAVIGTTHHKPLMRATTSGDATAKVVSGTTKKNELTSRTCQLTISFCRTVG